jgi:hypothetical protein
MFKGSSYQRLCLLIKRARQDLYTAEDRELLRRMLQLQAVFQNPPDDISLALLEERGRRLQWEWATSDAPKRRAEAAQREALQRSAVAGTKKIAKQNDPAQAERARRKQQDLAKMREEIRARERKRRLAAQAAYRKIEQAEEAAEQARLKRLKDAEASAAKIAAIVERLQRQRETRLARQHERKLKHIERWRLKQHGTTLQLTG